jgi:hypothetical protein
MKKYFFAILLSSISLCLFAQEVVEDKTNSEKAKEAVAAMKPKSTGSRDRLVVDLTFDQWLHDENGLKLKWHSRGFNTYFMYDIQLGKKKKLFSVAPGLGISTSSIFHNANVKDTVNGTTFNIDPTVTDNYKKNKFGLTYVDIPLELRFRSTPNAKNKSWKFALGFKAGVLIDSKVKVKQEDANGNMKIYKEKRYGDLNRFRYGATVRFGYGPFNFFGFYSIAKLFDKGMGPDITPISMGISINGL